MSRFLAGALRAVTPYTPGEQPRGVETLIKLNTNENPYPPSPKVLEALNGRAAENLRLYSDPACADFLAALAETFGVGRDQVFAGNGSDEVLAFAFLAFCEKGAAFADITYGFYPVFAQLFGIAAQEVPLREDFSVNTGDYAGVPGTVFLANPNAPTGLCLPLAEIEALLRQDPDRLVVVDEAYVDFGGVSALPLVDKYENLLVVQTFSKSRALAGMRIGFAIGQKKLISYLNDVKFSFNSYTMNRLTIACGKACVEDRGYFQEITGKIVATREWTKQKLTELGFTFPDSKANFIFATHKTVPAQELFENLKTAGIYVRYFKKPRIDNYLRITVGTQAEMERLVEVLAELVK